MPSMLTEVSKELAKAENEIALREWRTVIEEMDLNWNDFIPTVERIELEHKTQYDLIEKFLGRWAGKNGEEATVGKLIEILQQVEFKIAAGNLRNAWPNDTQISRKPIKKIKIEVKTGQEQDEDIDRIPLTQAESFPTGDDVYKCPPTGKTRGYALILNILDVEGHKKRNGGHKDSHRLHKLFQQLSFAVSLEDNTVQTQAHLTTELERFQKKLPQNKDDIGSVIVICCSHGESGLFFTGNKDEISVEDVVDAFQYKKLEGVPKIFIFQSCRGSMQIKCPVQKDGPDDKPEWKDTIVCYPTLDDFVAYRDEDDGSWYIRCLIKVIKMHAHNSHLKELLSKTKDELLDFSKGKVGKNNWKSEYIQFCHHNVDPHFKKFYFNTLP